MSYIRNVAATLADSANLDAFARLRTSTAYSIIENKYIHDSAPFVMEEVVSGTGASVSYLYQESACSLVSGTATDSFAIKQSRMYVPYIPGKSMSIIMTGVLGAADASCARRIGFFDNYNGLFFELTDTLKIVKRTNTSGTISDVPVAQTDWNLDTMDGNGPSGINLITTNIQIFMIDFQWLGAGRVRFGFDIDGIVHYCHEMKHANNVSSVYIKTSSLPMRYECRKLSGASSFTLKAVCCTAASESGYNPFSRRFSASRRNSLKTLNGTRLPIFAIRLKTAYGNSSTVPYSNRKLAFLYNAMFFSTTESVVFEIDHLTDISAITASFTSAGALSACEYSTDISAVTATYQNTIHTQYINAGGAGGAAHPGSGEMRAEYGVNTTGNVICQNYNSNNSQMYVVYATSLAGAPSAGCALEWLEYD